MNRIPPLSHPKVGVAWASLSPGVVDTEFHTSWTGAIRYDCLGESALVAGLEPAGCQHWLKGGEIQIITGPRVAEGRNQVVEAFLTRPEFNATEWLFFCDVDMTFEPDAICQLLGHAYAIDDKPKVMGGLCFAGGRSTRIFPTVYESVVDIDGAAVVQPVADYPRDATVKVGATGAAFILIHRQVLQHMFHDHDHRFPGFGSTVLDGKKVMNPNPWFVDAVNGAHQFGEDIAFCQRTNALGYGVYVHTGVKTGHVKRYQLTEELYDQRRVEAAQSQGTRAERRQAARSAR